MTVSGTNISNALKSLSDFLKVMEIHDIMIELQGVKNAESPFKDMPPGLITDLFLELKRFIGVVLDPEIDESYYMDNEIEIIRDSQCHFYTIMGYLPDAMIVNPNDGTVLKGPEVGKYIQNVIEKIRVDPFAYRPARSIRDIPISKEEMRKLKKAIQNDIKDLDLTDKAKQDMHDILDLEDDGD